MFKKLKSILSPKVFPICSLLVKLMKSKNDSDAKQKSATDMPHHLKAKSPREEKYHWKSESVSFSAVFDSVTQWTITPKALLFMEFSR